MITIQDIMKDINDWRNGKMGINALQDAIETYAQNQAKNISFQPPVSESVCSCKEHRKVPYTLRPALVCTICKLPLANVR